MLLQSIGDSQHNVLRPLTSRRTYLVYVHRYNLIHMGECNGVAYTSHVACTLAALFSHASILETKSTKMNSDEAPPPGLLFVNG
ncbi:hypothetical protein KPH14_001966 [Odynerus spinipes]|uniref:Uncharacterized protein n=1 Tax=Odynerus spinipes TaxID=1348599 RepID=A0AAD9S2E6_9HYME|nr:hypothetical protein KPH14_001966 [Odynerus spinipes]